MQCTDSHLHVVWYEPVLVLFKSVLRVNWKNVVPHYVGNSIFIWFVVAKAAPNWNGTAVVGDPPSFKELKLSDFKGKVYI